MTNTLSYYGTELTAAIKYLRMNGTLAFTIEALLVVVTQAIMQLYTITVASNGDLKHRTQEIRILCFCHYVLWHFIL